MFSKITFSADYFKAGYQEKCFKFLIQEKLTDALNNC